MAASSAVFFALLSLLAVSSAAAASHFVAVKGTQFILNKQPFYVNGANFYWLLYQAADPSTRPLVTRVMEEATGLGLTVGRTWAFNDGGSRALQLSPGRFDEKVFQALDFVISEAARNRIRLILSLSNNYDAYGGKKQYVQWAQNAGVKNLASEDSFFSDPTIRKWFKNYIKTILTRRNTISGLVYRDDPAIFAWELMNEPRCASDPSGNVLQAWIQEMAGYVKFLDKNHLLEVGMEGFYRNPSSQLAASNPGNDYFQQLGTDFIRGNLVSGIDFATVHAYPDYWFPQASHKQQISFLQVWISQHIQDAASRLRKPVLFSEFGKTSQHPGHVPSQRQQFLSLFYDSIYTSAKQRGAAAGGMFWHLFTEGMDNFDDGYQIIPSRDVATASLITQQSQRLTALAKSRRSRKRV